MSSEKDNRRQKRKKLRAMSAVMPKIVEEFRCYMPDPPPQREYEPCPISGKEIDNIIIALADPESGNPSRFESVIQKLADKEELKKNQRLVYIGAGNFGIVEATGKGNDRRLELVKKIAYEDSYQKKQWRKELSPGISRDYLPDPQPLDSLYTQDELNAFPKLGAVHLGSYMGKGN